MANDGIGTKATVFRLPEPLYEWLRRAAFEQRIPMNQIVVAALEKEKANAARIPGR